MFDKTMTVFSSIYVTAYALAWVYLVVRWLKLTPMQQQLANVNVNVNVNSSGVIIFAITTSYLIAKMI